MSLRRAKTLSRRSRLFVLWFAQLALIAYLFQLAAIDHWQPDPHRVVGLEGSGSHAQHCHGAGDCSDSGVSGPVLTPSVLKIGSPPSVGPSFLALTRARANDPILAIPTQPPRAS